MRERDYYRQTHAPAGTDEFCLEHDVSVAYETHIQRWISTLIDNPRSLSQEDFLQFIHHMEFQKLRVPTEHDRAKERIRQFAEALHMDQPDFPRGRVGDFFKVQIHDTYRFNFMKDLSEAGTYRRLFYRMVWDVCRADDRGLFVTTDNPVIVLNPCFPPPLSPPVNLAGSMVLYPLTPSWCLQLRHPEVIQQPQLHPMMVVPDMPVHTDQIEIRHGIPLSKDDVDTVNFSLALSAKRFVAASDTEPLKKLQIELAQNIKGQLCITQ